MDDLTDGERRNEELQEEPQMEEPDDETLRNLALNASLVIEEIQELVDFEFGFTVESLRWFDGYVDRLRDSGDPPSEEALHIWTSVFGSYVGEMIIRTLGGVWKWVDGQLAVILPDGSHAYPMNKTAKQLTEKEGHSLFEFYKSVLIMPQMEKAMRRGLDIVSIDLSGTGLEVFRAIEGLEKYGWEAAVAPVPSDAALSGIITPSLEVRDYGHVEVYAPARARSDARPVAIALAIEKKRHPAVLVQVGLEKDDRAFVADFVFNAPGCDNVQTLLFQTGDKELFIYRKQEE